MQLLTARRLPVTAADKPSRRGWAVGTIGRGQLADRPNVIYRPPRLMAVWRRNGIWR